MNFETSFSLPKYFKSFKKVPLLTKEEEIQLATRIKQGDLQALNLLIKSNLKLVVKIANNHIGQGVSIDDLIQEGNIGLYEAAKRFNIESNTRFATYASLWIRKKLNEAVVQFGRQVRLPQNVEYEIYKNKKVGESDPFKLIRIDAPVEDSQSTIGDILLSSIDSYEQDFEKAETSHLINKLISVLTSKEEEILKKYFGIGCEYPMSADAISEEAGLSHVRIHQIIKKSLDKIKEEYGSK
jgi:RNA polymerase primary sigma factor